MSGAENEEGGGDCQICPAKLAGAAGEFSISSPTTWVASTSRMAPDIPPLAESGLPGFDHSSWYGLWGPKGLPQGLTAALNVMFDTAVKELDAGGRLAQFGIEPVAETSEQFARFAAGYVERNAQLLKLAKYEPV